MIWMRRQDRLSSQYGEWHRWMAWRPVMAKHFFKNQYDDDAYSYVWVWFSRIERRYCGEWMYRLCREDDEVINERMVAIRLAPRYAKEIILMSKTG